MVSLLRVSLSEDTELLDSSGFLGVLPLPALPSDTFEPLTKLFVEFALVEDPLVGLLLLPDPLPFPPISNTAFLPLSVGVSGRRPPFPLNQKPPQKTETFVSER